MSGIIKKLSLKEVGSRVKHIREQRGISMFDVGTAMGKTTRDAANSLVKHIEAGTRKSFNDEELAQILSFFKMTEADFLAANFSPEAANTLFEMIPDLVDHVEALRLAKKIGDPSLIKSTLMSIRDRIDKEIES